MALAILGLLALATVGLLRAKIARLWLRICIRATGVVLAVPLILAILLLLLLGACSTRPRVIVSPDSQHIARYDYQAGFLGRDSSFVSVRNKWSLLSDDVYEYWGPSDWDGANVRWLNNRQLIIQYYPDRSGRHQECDTKGAGIEILCVPLRR